jgi:HlyD family secretion protein
MNMLDKAPARADIEAILKAGETRNSRWRRVALLLLIAGLAAGAYALLRSESRPAAVYTAEAAEQGRLIVTVTATGTVQPINQVDVSSELSGIIRQVYVDYNSEVTAGQVLAELDTVTLNAQVERSRAALAAARARVAQAEATVAETKSVLDRTSALTARQFSSENALDVAKANHNRALAALQSAIADVSVEEATLKQNETSLSKAKIYSPIDGVVLRRVAEPGQTVASSFQAPTLFILAANLREVELQVDVDEADIGQVREGQRATFTVEAYQGRRFPAIISTVRYAPETVNGVVTYKAILKAENEDLALRPGMTVTAEIVVEDLDGVLLIPNTALRWRPPEPPRARQGGGGFTLFRFPRRDQQVTITEQQTDRRRVYVLQEGAPAAVDIVVGASDGRRTVVMSGLEAGQQVITASEGPGDGG